MSALTVLLAVGILVYVISQQVMGSALTGRRVIVLPAALTIIGIVNITGHSSHPSATDIALIVVSAVIAIAIGAALGTMTHIERRNGSLWAQLPKKGLWLWAALIATRLVVTVIAHLANAHVAAGTDAILLVLGLNRAAQAMVVVPRAIRAGIPFAPDKNGKVFGASWFAAASSREN